MKVSYNWLKDFVDLEGVGPEQIAEKLTTSGFEVEDVIYMNKHLHDVYVGKIEKITKHPEADRLVVCQVNVGDKNVQIVTSATNVFEGALVPVSLDGADLANGIQIKPSKFRGVLSDGMFCSGEELGIDDNYIEGASVNGILIFPKDFVAGTKVEDALLLNDVVFDINVTPNRPDCNSVVGIAREVCAIFGKKFREADLSYKTVGENVNNYVNITIATENCFRYTGAYIKNIRLERSPLWLRSRLFSVGIKPICNMVDITNYILVEQGQPMHAFDYKYLDGHEIVVRQAKSGEKIEVLNGQTYELDKDVMVIADKNKPVVIAGVIGGVNSCISDSTKESVFECAVFDLKSVRLTAKKFGLRTDSSARYEKGVNINTPTIALKRALHLVNQLQCGDIVDGIIDKVGAQKKIGLSEKLTLSYSKVNKILGINVEKEKMLAILNGLGIESTISGDVLTCVPPYIREDIKNENDIAEEVIRIYGYDVYNNVEGTMFENSSITIGQYEPRLTLENGLKNILVDSGFFETLNYSLYSPSAPDKLLLAKDDARRNVIKIANPISEDLSTVRTLMAHALLLDLSYNLSVGNKDLRLFEVGRVYQPKELPLKELPVENNRLSIAVCENGYDFYQLKNVIENLLVSTSLDYKLERSKEPYLHSGVSADIVAKDGKVVGWFGKVHKNVLKNYDINQDVYYAELDTDYIASLPEKKYETKEVSKFQPVERDIAVVVDENVTNAELVGAIKSACGKNFYDVTLFDVYRHESLGVGKKSMAYKIVFMSNEATLTGEEINSAVAKVLKSLDFRFGAKLRQV
ncbi:MAG: phenylalanine--tRNA ligase subunit beta [Clostridia bacterium]|nr:phenylalanine--tRNA ligase subunit beta [Clostridia bacterium]